MTTQNRFKELLEDFDTAMLVTSSKDAGLRSRPMAVAGIDEAGDVIFATEVASPKVEEILRHPQVNVSCQERTTFLSLSGTAEIVTEPETIQKHWETSWKAWFPEGADQEDLALVKVTPESGEFWNFGTRDQIQFLFEKGKAVIEGEEVDYEDIGENKKVSFG